MKYKSVFEIIGPVMIGPSSSHTAGAARIGRLARRIFGGRPDKIEVHFFGSFAQTYKGHATDVAVVGGILDFDTDDIRIQDAVSIAEDWGITVEFICEDAVPEHPNTLMIILENNQSSLQITGVSVGGGTVQITELNGFSLKLSGDHPTLLVLHQDVYGMVAAVTGLITKQKVNICHMELSRLEKGKTALMVIETDQIIKQELVNEIEKLEYINKVIVLQE